MAPSSSGLRQAATRSALPARASAAERYRRAAEPAVRGMAGAAVFLVVLAAGYGLEYLVAARTGRRSLGAEARHAEDR